ncbi:restriction endonuclease subunit S [Streptomyces sp. NPDC048551]|uniref:restriction endonuclease subunit S n=1 Tax=Streptomyces sp. NPDC048551 TaxID=3155758 RepID=UPI00343864B4
MTDAAFSLHGMTPLRRFINEIADGPFGSALTSSHYADSGARVIRLGNIGSSAFRNQDAAFISLDYFAGLKRHEVKPGDLLIAGLGDENHPVGRACVAPEGISPAIVKADCFRARLDETRLTHRYAAWALSSSFVAQQVQTMTRGSTRARINLEVAREIAIPAPGIEKQHRIADFLDAETARIDLLRGLREQQLSLLAEAAVCRVYDVVRGASVAGERKDSGLNWLGSVPESWRVAAVSHFFDVELGKMLNEERSTGDHLRPYLRVANVQWDRIEVDELARMNFPPDEQNRYRLRKGDLLVNEGGSWPGRAAIWTDDTTEMYYQKALHRIRPRADELTRWLYYCLLLAERMRVFQVQGNTSTMTHLTREQLRPQRFPFPERATQAVLVAQLDAAAERDKGLQARLHRQLALLAERRQALITAAVTGQFDVSTASGRNVTEGITA